MNVFIKYRDNKVQQRRITKCNRSKNYKLQQRCITNYDKSWITKYDKKFRIGLQNPIPLQSVTSLDYKLLWGYKVRLITK